MHTKNDELQKPTNTFEIELICKRQIRYYMKNDNEVNSFIINLCAHFLNEMKKIVFGYSTSFKNVLET